MIYLKVWGRKNKGNYYKKHCTSIWTNYHLVVYNLEHFGVCPCWAGFTSIKHQNYPDYANDYFEWSQKWCIPVQTIYLGIYNDLTGLMFNSFKWNCLILSTAKWRRISGLIWTNAFSAGDIQFSETGQHHFPSEDQKKGKLHLDLRRLNSFFWLKITLRCDSYIYRVVFVGWDADQCIAEPFDPRTNLDIFLFYKLDFYNGWRILWDPGSSLELIACSTRRLPSIGWDRINQGSVSQKCHSAMRCGT